MDNYAEFISNKRHAAAPSGFSPCFMPDFLFDFQRDLVEWACKIGRAAIFADCGLGKTPMQLVWAENVARKTKRPVLIIAPLAVSHQIEREAKKFDIRAARSADGSVPSTIVITNYERLDRFDPKSFSGAVCDESSILKNFNGARRRTITEFMRGLDYRLLCTATAAPNDYVELGTSSEALGHMGMMDMLSAFFKNTQSATVDIKSRWRRHGEGVPKWRFKGHSSEPFWRWVCSWARAIRKPSDLGYNDDGFILPALSEREHIIKARALRDGWLFDVPAVGLHEEREETRRTIRERCERVAELVDHEDQALVWCHLNDEGDLLSRLIPESTQVKGSTPDNEKEDRLLGFADGKIRCLITKPKIGAWGLNLQGCNHITFFPSHSYEQYYQGVRRCWRFGQKREVLVDIISTEGSHRAMDSIHRKAKQADEMFSSLVLYMKRGIEGRHGYSPFQKEEVPSWLSTK